MKQLVTDVCSVHSVTIPTTLPENRAGDDDRSGHEPIPADPNGAI